ncbi:TetR/AcrR family transcriptional regulator [Agromyces laixinhei]|uniref:TetR/AcrR family transcriptional regulator n=1 Tax=Agromyces laixinhei TaxID=2585717 RepID=UPI0012EE84C2|nr:TetR/AcrR family transcriptional regulator [Agromyces laixinhei]
MTTRSMANGDATQAVASEGTSRDTGRRERKRRTTRDAIAAAATELFVARGFAQTTIAEIADRADVAPRTFFLHFASKEDVLFHHLEHSFDIAADAVRSMPDSADAWAAVQQAVGALIETLGTPSTDALAPIRAELARRSGGLPPSLAVRLHTTQGRILDAVRERYGERAIDAAHLGACIGAVSASAVDALAGSTTTAGDPGALDDARASMRHALERAGVGFRRG